MDNQKFQVKQESFEGPLDLLLNLIEKRKLHISEVSLAKVVDDYIAHIQKSENLSVAENSHFILIASTLTLIKSKALLPMLDLTEEEQSDIDDLEKRLKEYKKYKDLSLHIENMYGKNPMYVSQKQVHIDPIFSPEKGMTVSSIREAIGRVLATLPKPEKMAETIVQKVISLEEMIDQLTDRVTKSLKMSFSEFSGKNGKPLNKEEKVNVVVSFLAMLELVKQEIVSVVQDKDFGDIQIESQSVGLPKYE